MKRLLYALLCCLMLLPMQADEGMWMPGNLNKPVRRQMKELGMEMAARKLYHPRHASLKDAIVSFGGFCSGVVVSEEGLLLTNHHCGFGSIQQHASVERDYLKEGFVAARREEELPCHGLYARFLIRQEEVTDRVLAAVTDGMSEQQRMAAIDSMVYVVEEAALQEDSTLIAMVDAYYGGTEFWLSTYRDYNDVRLVLAPPTSVGKFGWDRDNWMWPRHTGDFCIFRIYADKENRPADYAQENRPYRPRYVAPVSTQGYKEGDFCMTMGYPGSTDRYLSSYGIEEQMKGENLARIEVRGVKQEIWKRAMAQSDSIRIKYAKKYDESSNYWKNSMGMNRSIERLNLLERKRAAEEELLRWIRLNRDETTAEWLHLFTTLELNYEARREVMQAQAYFLEAFWNAPELLLLAMGILNLDVEGDAGALKVAVDELQRIYADYLPQIDKEVFAEMLKLYRQKVDTRYLPAFYHRIEEAFAGDVKAFVESIYAHSAFTDAQGLQRVLQRDTTFHLADDAAINICFDLLTTWFEMNMEAQQPGEAIQKAERQLTEATRMMYSERNFYPDANSTMRLSIGTVSGYTPRDGVEYGYYTTTKGIVQKEQQYKGDEDFWIQPALLSTLKGDYGRWADEKGQMRVCFITDNDITGGNSGSAMFNARGELIGLAFDGNWEAMSSDLQYEPRLQRCIGVDIRYMFFYMEKYAKATHLLKEIIHNY